MRSRSVRFFVPHRGRPHSRGTVVLKGDLQVPTEAVETDVRRGEGSARRVVTHTLDCEERRGERALRGETNSCFCKGCWHRRVRAVGSGRKEEKEKWRDAGQQRDDGRRKGAFFLLFVVLRRGSSCETHVSGPTKGNFEWKINTPSTISEPRRVDRLHLSWGGLVGLWICLDA